MLQATSASPRALAGLALWAIAAMHAQRDFFREFHDGDAIAAYMAELAARDHVTLRTLGTSVEGRPIQALEIGSGDLGIALDGGMHAREWLSVATPLCIAERLATDPQAQKILEHVRFSIVPLLNPDGYHVTWTTDRYQRKNARGVDLNRNFPTSNWSADPVFYKTRKSDARDIMLTTGSEPASEPETKALIALIERLRPRAVVSLHSALACIDDSGPSHLGKLLAERCELPLLTEIGYPTPGSMGTWASERKLDLATFEVEDASLYTLKDHHVPILIDLMTGRFPLQA